MTLKTDTFLCGPDGDHYYIESVDRTWYRAVGANGKVWCESSSPTEVEDSITGRATGLLVDGWHLFTLQRLESYSVRSPWKEWHP